MPNLAARSNTQKMMTMPAWSMVTRHHLRIFLVCLLSRLLPPRKTKFEAGGIPFLDSEQVIQGNCRHDIEYNVRPNNAIVAPSIAPEYL